MLLLLPTTSIPNSVLVRLAVMVAPGEFTSRMPSPSVTFTPVTEGVVQWMKKMDPAVKSDTEGLARL